MDCPTSSTLTTTITPADETASAVRMIVLPNDSPPLQVGSTITVLSQAPSSSAQTSSGAGSLIINNANSQQLHFGETVTVLSQSPSGQIIPDGKIAVINNSTSNIIQPPCGSGRITILKPCSSAIETSGGVKMIGSYLGNSKVPHVGATVTIVNEVSSPSLVSSFSLPTELSLCNFSNSIQTIPFSSENTQGSALKSTFPRRKYVYKSGTQYPPDLNKPRAGSTLDIVLKTSPMIEIFSLNRKESIYYYHAACHSCKTEYKNSTAKTLSMHVASSMHERRLTIQEDLNVDVKEQSRRQLLISNKKFSSFLHLQEDQTLWCKWCNVQLPFSNDKITSHRYTVKHLAAAGENEATTFTEEEKLEKLKKLVEMFPDVLALVDEVEKRINDEFFEYYKDPDQITLQINDLYCKPCRRKFVRNNPNSYREAVVEHIRTKQHKAEVEKQAARANDRTRPRSPPRKITTFQHDTADLKEVARTLMEASTSKRASVPLHNVFTPVSDRMISAASLNKGFQMLDVEIDEKTQQNILNTLGKANRQRTKKLGKFKSRAGYKKKKRDKERQAFLERQALANEDEYN